jgi:hypothetical protein
MGIANNFSDAMAIEAHYMRTCVVSLLASQIHHEFEKDLFGF